MSDIRGECALGGEGVGILGETVLDVMVSGFSNFPAADPAVPVKRISCSLGGCGANSAVTAARLGAKTRLYSHIGCDRWPGDHLVALLSAEPNLTLCAERRAPDTTVTVVLVHDRGVDRSFLFEEVSAGAVTRRLFVDSVLAPRVFLYAGFFSYPRFVGDDAAQLFARLRREGSVNIMGLSWCAPERAVGGILPCLPLLDYLVCNEDEAVAVSREGTRDDAIGWLLASSSNLQAAIVTCGAVGAYWCERGRSPSLTRAFPASPLVDPTGAGDAFTGAFVEATHRSLHERAWEPIERRITFAAAAGALACRSLGGQPSFSRDEVLTLSALHLA